MLIEQVEVAVNDVAADCISLITLMLQMWLFQAKAMSLMLLRLTKEDLLMTSADENFVSQVQNPKSSLICF